MTTATKADKAADAAVHKAPAIKQEIVNLAAAIRADIKIDAATGVATVGPDLYERLLPEGLTVDIIKQVKEHDTKIIAAVPLALGEEAIPVMKKNKGLENATLIMPTVGKDTIGATFTRQREATNPAAPGTTMTIHGAVRVEMTQYANGSRGELAKVKTALREMAWDAFGKK
jgi:CRISPR/Cas system CMR subunit Cmr4 (Cas7 group RAMP superfamily)